MSPVGLSTPKRTDPQPLTSSSDHQIRIEHERTDRRRHELHRLNVAAERPDRLARARPRSRPVLHEVVARVAANDRIDLCPIHADNDNPALDQEPACLRGGGLTRAHALTSRMLVRCEHPAKWSP